MPMLEKLRLLRAGIVPFLIFFFMTGLFVFGYTSLRRKLRRGSHRRYHCRRRQRPAELAHADRDSRKTLAISAMFMWLILAALAFGCRL